MQGVGHKERETMTIKELEEKAVGSPTAFARLGPCTIAD